MSPPNSGFEPFCYVRGSCAGKQPSQTLPGEFWADCVIDDGSNTGNSLECGSTVRGSTRGLGSQIGWNSGEATYEFTPSAGGIVTFDLCDSEFDTYLRILDGSREVAVNDDHNGRCGNSGTRLASHLQVTLQEGHTYNVIVEGYRDSEGTFELDVTCNQADTIACGQTMRGSTVGRPNIIGSRSGEAIYHFIASRREYVFDACQSSYDSLIRVYRGTISEADRVGSTLVALNDDSGRCSSNRRASYVTVRTIIGQTYTLVVEGYNREEGEFIITTRC